MSNVIAFLESMGRNASLSRLSGDDYAAAVGNLELDDSSRQALLARDAQALNGLAGGRLQMMCILLPADGDENQKDQNQEDGDEPGQGETKESIRH